MSGKDKKKAMEEELPEPRIQTDQDFDEFITACNEDQGWELCYDKEDIFIESYCFLCLFLFF